jgi:hypothetical protein
MTSAIHAHYREASGGQLRRRSVAHVTARSRHDRYALCHPVTSGFPVPLVKARSYEGERSSPDSGESLTVSPAVS